MKFSLANLLLLVCCRFHISRCSTAEGADTSLGEPLYVLEADKRFHETFPADLTMPKTNDPPAPKDSGEDSDYEMLNGDAGQTNVLEPSEHDDDVMLDGSGHKGPDSHDDGGDEITEGPSVVIKTPRSADPPPKASEAEAFLETLIDYDNQLALTLLKDHSYLDELRGALRTNTVATNRWMFFSPDMQRRFLTPFVLSRASLIATLFYEVANHVSTPGMQAAVAILIEAFLGDVLSHYETGKPAAINALECIIKHLVLARQSIASKTSHPLVRMLLSRVSSNHVNRTWDAVIKKAQGGAFVEMLNGFKVPQDGGGGGGAATLGKMDEDEEEDGDGEGDDEGDEEDEEDEEEDGGDSGEKDKDSGANNENSGANNNGSGAKNENSDANNNDPSASIEKLDTGLGNTRAREDESKATKDRNPNNIDSSANVTHNHENPKDLSAADVYELINRDRAIPADIKTAWIELVEKTTISAECALPYHPIGDMLTEYFKIDSTATTTT